MRATRCGLTPEVNPAQAPQKPSKISLLQDLPLINQSAFQIQISVNQFCWAGFLTCGSRYFFFCFSRMKQPLLRPIAGLWVLLPNTSLTSSAAFSAPENIPHWELGPGSRFLGGRLCSREVPSSSKSWMRWGVSWLLAGFCLSLMSSCLI